MATPTPSSNPTPAPPHVVGTFVQVAASFIVRPTAAEVAVWRQARRHEGDFDSLIESYVIIKLLAPEASAGLQLEVWPVVKSIITQIDHHLVQRYLRERTLQQEHR